MTPTLIPQDDQKNLPAILAGHKHLTTTQIYDKRRIATSESASHEVPL
jgi:hypothetical protein